MSLQKSEIICVILKSTSIQHQFLGVGEIHTLRLIVPDDAVLYGQVQIHLAILLLISRINTKTIINSLAVHLQILDGQARFGLFILIVSSGFICLAAICYAGNRAIECMLLAINHQICTYGDGDSVGIRHIVNQFNGDRIFGRILGCGGNSLTERGIGLVSNLRNRFSALLLV